MWEQKAGQYWKNREERIKKEEAAKKTLADELLKPKYLVPAGIALVSILVSLWLGTKLGLHTMAADAYEERSRGICFQDCKAKLTNSDVDCSVTCAEFDHVNNPHGDKRHHPACLDGCRHAVERACGMACRGEQLHTCRASNDKNVKSYCTKYFIKTPMMTATQSSELRQIKHACETGAFNAGRNACGVGSALRT
jgi:hypothetical protein